jgi:uncharacterized protein
LRRREATKFSNNPSSAPLLWGAALYLLLIAGFWVGVRQSALAAHLGESLPWALGSFALLLAPLWLFGFSAADPVGATTTSARKLVPLSALLAFPYYFFAIPTRQFHWEFGAVMLILPVLLAWILALPRVGTKLGWQDVVVLGAIAAVHMLKLLAGAWASPGLASLSKLYLIDVALYLYLLVRRLDGMGYSLVPHRTSVTVGLREFCFFLPFGLGLGTALRFIRFHGRMPSGWAIAGAVLFTFLFVALPEEIFFRAILQNLLETRTGRTWAVTVAALLFGLGHFNKGASFNWRYVMLAAIAGIFYGRAWRAHRQVLASAITHTAVDVVWSLWFR